MNPEIVKIGNRYKLTPYEQLQRKQLHRKLIIILSMQLLVTLSFLIPINFVEPIKAFIDGESRINIAATILFVAVTVLVIFFSSLAREYPYSYILISTLTGITAFWVSVICTKYEAIHVAVAIAVTVVLSAVLGTYAKYTSHDFTVLLGVLLVVTLIALILAIIYFISPASDRVKWAILIGSMILTDIYFVVDVQMIIAGDRLFFLDAEDDILSACILYIDFIYIFVYALMIAGDIGKKLDPYF